MSFLVMHPSARFLIWLFFTIAIQQYSATALLLSGVVLCMMSLRLQAGQEALRLIRRGRWLLFSLWLITAYSLPGEVWSDLYFLPSNQGITEANRHLLVLVLILSSLACFLHHQPPNELLAGLWGLSTPLRYLGLPVQRSLARLVMVFDYLQTMQQHKPSWQTLLAGLSAPNDNAYLPQGETQILHLLLPAWQQRDTAYVLATFIFLLALALC